MRLLYQLIPKRNNQGFALPLILGIGMIMSLAATSMIVSTQGQQKQVQDCVLSLFPGPKLIMSTQ